MSNEIKDSGYDVFSCAQGSRHFIWLLSKSLVSDEMNRSYGLSIDADRWDFHARTAGAVHPIAPGRHDGH